VKGDAEYKSVEVENIDGEWCWNHRWKGNAEDEVRNTLKTQSCCSIYEFNLTPHKETVKENNITLWCKFGETYLKAPTESNGEATGCRCNAGHTSTCLAGVPRAFTYSVSALVIAVISFARVDRRAAIS